MKLTIMTAIAILAPSATCAWQCPCGYAGPEECWDSHGNLFCDTNEMVWGSGSRRRLQEISDGYLPFNVTNEDWKKDANATLEKFRPKSGLNGTFGLNGTLDNGSNSTKRKLLSGWNCPSGCK